MIFINEKKPVEEELKKCRQMIGAPRKEFTDSLREKIQKKFLHSEGFFEQSLLNMVDVSSAEHFRCRLKEELLEEHSRMFSKRNLASHIPSHYPAFFRFLKGSVPVTFSVMVFFSAILFGVSPQSQALQNTLVTSYFGDVYVSHQQEGQQLPAEVYLGEGTVVKTGEYSGATIRFFEDSVLRMDSETTIVIDTLEPHPVQNDLGEVRVVLSSGKAWVKTFSLDEEYSRFHLILPGSEVVLDSGGAVDAFVSGSSKVVRSWDRIVRVRDEDGGGVVLSGGRQLVDRFNSITVSPIPEADAEHEWVLSNKAWDETISVFFVEEKIKQKRSEAVSTLEKMKKAFISPFSDSSEKELLELEIIFFDSLSDLSLHFDEYNHDSLDDFSEKARSLFRTHPEKVEAFFASTEKTLHSVLPDSPLFVAKEQIESLQKEFAEVQQDSLLAEKQKTKRLWEVTLLVDAGQMALAEELMKTASEASHEMEAEATPEILDERQEQLAALGTMEENEALWEIASEMENEIIEETSVIVRPGFPTGQTKTTTERAYEVISKIKKYESNRGRLNVLRNELSAIDKTAENISLLIEIKDRLPDDLKGEIDEKVLNIMEEERRRAQEKILFSIE